MGKIKLHKPVKFFEAVTFSNAFDLNNILERIEFVFGEIENKSTVYPFDQFTDYYAPEMGKNLNKLFVSFTKLHEPDHLIQYKVQSNHLEDEFLLNDQRQVNLDPGYITEAKLVLATTKDYSHRLYLGMGIFGDIHMYFENGTFQKQFWTYPDYQQPLAINYFNELRIRYREQMVDF